MGSGEDRMHRNVELHGFVTSIDIPPELDDRLAIVLSAYPDAGASGPADLEIRVERDAEVDTVWHVHHDDRIQTELSSDRAAARIEWLIVMRALRSWTRFIHVHAALVGDQTASALLIGRSGSGKSTTSVAMAAAGWDLYSDDVALVDRSTHAAWCCPRPIKLDDDAKALLAPLGVTVREELTVGEPVSRTSLPGLPEVCHPGPPVTCAFFFAGRREDVPTIRAISKSESALRLMPQSSTDAHSEDGLTPEAFALISSVACYELVPGNLADTVEAIAQTIRSTP